MRIGISGTQNIGKSTVVTDFLKKWDTYETPTLSYRDVLKEKGLPCNKETTPETQTIIMNHLCDQLMYSTIADSIITDRTPYDVLVYSLYQNAKGVDGFTDEYITKQIELAREASTFYDIIFQIPIVKDHDVKMVEDGVRDTDPQYREEIDNIFGAIYKTYFDQNGPFFKFEDCPAVIEIFGTPEERIKMVEMYVSEDGSAYGDDDSLISDEIAGEIFGGDVPDIVT